jgi:hypothetical protein
VRLGVRAIDFAASLERAKSKSRARLTNACLRFKFHAQFTFSFGICQM